jgi:hypothetical protein
LGFVASDFRFRQFAKLGVKSILKIDLAARGNVSFWPVAVNAVADFAGADIFRVPGDFRIESFNPSANCLSSQ